MACKGFRVNVNLDLHVINCPGVWLCPNGSVALRINTLNAHIESRKLTPTFPLIFEDKFTFKKIFTNICTLTQLECCLKNEYFYLELIQWPGIGCKGILLSTFETNLFDLLYPAPCYKSLTLGTDVDLLMEPTKYFPGIIAPKVEISTHTVVEEICVWEYDVAKYQIVNPKLLNSKSKCIHRKPPAEGIIRQKRVCHSQGRVKPPNIGCKNACCCLEDHCNTNYPKNNVHIKSCYQQNRKYFCQVNKQPLDICTPQHHNLDDCSVCLKYKKYFSKDSESSFIQKIQEKRKQIPLDYCDDTNCDDASYKSSFNYLLKTKIRNLQRSLNKN